MAKLKTKPTTVKVDDFINAIEHEKKRAEGFIILALIKKVCKLEPHMWGPSIIGFGSYHYKYDSGHEGDAPLMGFSPRKANHVIYILNDNSKQEAILKRLGKFKTGKVCLYINKLADVNLEVLEELIMCTWKHVKDR